MIKKNTKITMRLSTIMILSVFISLSGKAQEVMSVNGTERALDTAEKEKETEQVQAKSIQSSPASFSYQAVLRNSSGQLMENQQVSVDVEILEGSASGTPVFSESHTISTNAYGLVSLEIGSVNDLSTLSWSAYDYFISISVDGVLMGTSQLLSVPFAMHANTASVAENTHWTDDGSNLFYNSGSDVGIGTSTPVANLELLRNNDMTNSQLFLSQDGTGDATLGFYLDGPSDNFGMGIDQSDESKFKITPSFTISDSDPALTIDQTKQVGIGTASPETSLHVEGGTKVGANGVVIQEVMELTGTTDASITTFSISYPSGYDETNTRVLSAEIKTNASWGDWTSLGGSVSGADGTVRTKVANDGLWLFYPDDTSFKDTNYRISIMRIE
ncbi:MAG: hypothetical protein ACQES0_10420 [Bacteroidota bacterium]